MALPRRASSWYDPLRAGAWLTIALGLLIVLGLAGLHYYQQERLERATRIARELGRASNDLSRGFLHFTLGGAADAPWRRDEGYALLTQAFTEFDRAAHGVQIPAELASAFRSDMERFRALLMRSAQNPTGATERDAVDLRLALHRLESTANRVDRLLLEDLERLDDDLERAFGWSLAASLLLLGAVFVAVHRTRRHALAAVNLLDSIASSATDSVYAKDLQGRYLLFNKEASRVTGIPAEDVLGRDDRVLFPPAEVERVVANDRLAIEAQATHTHEEEITTARGVVTFLSTKGPLIDRDGAVVGTFGMSRDITERKAAERALRDSEAQLETIIESLDEGLVIVSPDGNVMRWNQTAAAMYERAPGDDWLGEIAQFRDLYEITTLDGALVPFEEWPLSRIVRGERLRNLELSIRRTDKSWSRIHSFGGTLVRNESGQPLFAVLTISDVTARHQAEESLRRAQRMEALGSLAAGIAHDFNNILMAIGGNARLAQDELPKGHAARESLHEILRASSRATDLVRSILLFARAQDPQRQIAKLAPIIEEALALVRPTAPARIRFKAQLGGQVPPVSIDSSQIHQVIVNLLTNSVYAIVHGPERPEGRIEIVLGTFDCDAEHQPIGHPLPAGRYVRLQIEDDGGGMDPATLARIFDPFFTTKPAGQGTGLGMSVVHGIVRNHDGAIDVQSQPGQGTSVAIYLPAAVGEVTTSAAPQEARARGSEKRVLYLDDEEPLVLLAVRFLRKRGHEVTGFVNPIEALRAFKAQPHAYDIVVTDMSMPAMSGFDVAKAMINVRPDIVILMMSGYVRPEDRDNALALGVKELMLKPSTIDELADAVDRQVS